MKLKVCGMREAGNIKRVAELAPDYMGFIFYRNSKRFVGDDFVMPPISSQIKKVGVFVNSSVEEIREKINKYKLDYAQLHGNESLEFCSQLPASMLIKAFGIGDDFDFGIPEAYVPFCSYFLFDTHTDVYGGSGKKFDWRVLDNYHCNTPFFLSGGIGTGDIGKVMKLAAGKKQFCAIDVNSKLEKEPGLKDIAGVEELMSNLRNSAK